MLATGSRPQQRPSLSNSERSTRNSSVPQPRLHPVRAMPLLRFEELPVPAAARPDLPRSGHAACHLPSSHPGADMLVFGGYVETPDKQREATNAAWLFSSSSNSWTPVQCSASAATGDVPEPRIAAQLVLVDGLLVLIGGWNPSKQGPDAFLSDVWTLDPATWTWTRRQLQGEPLQGISRHQAVAVGQDVYLHTHRNLEDIYVLRVGPGDGAVARLDKLAVAGPGPSSRGLHSLVAQGGALYLFGGAPQHGQMLGDLWRLDLGSPQQLAWKQVHPTGASPHVRCSCVAAPLGERYILYWGGAYYGEGGTPGLQMLGDALLLDTQQEAWVQAQTAGALPAPRNAAASVVLPAADAGGSQTVLMYGGWEAFKQSFNDTWRVTLEE